MPNTICVKIGAALAALALTTIPAAAAADPSPGGLGFDDPAAPTIFPDGSTLTSPVSEMLGDVVRFEGTVAGAHAGDDVAVQWLGAGGWTTATTATAGDGGSFVATWQPQHAGRASVRVVPMPSAGTVRAASSPSDAARELTVFKPVTATWYGPGFYGKRTACGQRLTRHLLGVAHRRLPCGTPVELYKDGRTITVPVVDRGPFNHGATYDLTAATAKALGVATTTQVGAVHG